MWHYYKFSFSVVTNCLVWVFSLLCSNIWILILQKVQEEVLKEYKKMKQRCPNYHEEKQRCEYLHNKLAHIKRLIADFDQRRAQPWCWEHSTQYSHWSVLRVDCRTRRGESNWLLFNPPSVTASSHTSLSLPFSLSLILFHSFIHFWSWNSTGFIVACDREYFIWLLYPSLLFWFFFFFPVEELLWSLIPLDQWKELPACVKGFEEILQLFLPFFLKDFIFRQKKEQKKYFWVSEKY